MIVCSFMMSSSRMAGKKRMFSAEVEAAELSADSDSETEWFDGDDDEGPTEQISWWIHCAPKRHVSS
jgi:hypothetical protein